MGKEKFAETCFGFLSVSIVDKRFQRDRKKWMENRGNYLSFYLESHGKVLGKSPFPSIEKGVCGFQVAGATDLGFPIIQLKRCHLSNGWPFQVAQGAVLKPSPFQQC